MEKQKSVETESETDEQDLSILPYLSYASHTDVGKKREENQDSFGVIEREEGQVFVVADGMGGVRGGAIASQLAIEVFENSLADTLTPENYVSAVQLANDSVFHRGVESPGLSGMGTTFIALCFSRTTLHVLHVGDSRAYRFRSGRVEQLTHDHTLIQELVDSGALTEEQAEDHPVSHMLTRSLGPADKVVPDCLLMKDGPVSGDRYLLCSDGLYNLVEAEEIAELISGISDEEAVHVLVDLANERGGTDNITVILVSVSDEYPKGIEDLPATIRAASSAEDTQELSRATLIEAFRQTSEPQSGELETGEEVEQERDQEDGARMVPYEGNGLLRNGSHRETTDLSLEVSDLVSGSDGRQRSIIPVFIAFAAGLALFGVMLIGRTVPPRSVAVARVPEGENPIGKSLPPGEAVVERAQTPSESTREEESTSLPPESSERDPLSSGGQAGIESVKQTKDAPEPEPVEEGPREEGEAAFTSDEELDTILASIKSDREDIQRSAVSPALVARKLLLEQQAEKFERYVSLLQGPVSGTVGETLRVAPQEKKETQRELRSVRSEIDVATRKLSVWYDRKRRLESADILSLSAEVAGISPPVRDAKQVFDRVTWEYLRQAEAFQYDPGNTDLRKNLVSLRKKRQAQLIELERVVRDIVVGEIQSSDEKIAQLTRKRELIEERLRSLKKDEEIARVILEGNQEKQQQLLQAVEEELKVVLGELEELRGVSSSPGLSDVSIETP
ncbi:Stp1/IreP family PP2C-type Ser/Thr phosphatase [bacterium]|nr:Stp1/IreP family PP2C-type Ser/Thr phosphatase [bacterium]